jgi:hypothetical protein
LTPTNWAVENSDRVRMQLREETRVQQRPCTHTAQSRSIRLSPYRKTSSKKILTDREVQELVSYDGKSVSLRRLCRASQSPVCRSRVPHLVHPVRGSPPSGQVVSYWTGGKRCCKVSDLRKPRLCIETNVSQVRTSLTAGWTRPHKSASALGVGNRFRSRFRTRIA